MLGFFRANLYIPDTPVQYTDGCLAYRETEHAVLYPVLRVRGPGHCLRSLPYHGRYVLLQVSQNRLFQVDTVCSTIIIHFDQD